MGLDRLIAIDGLPLDERELALIIARAFRETFTDTHEATLPECGRSILRQEVGRAFEEARLAWDRLNPEPPLSEFNNIACALGAFPDFPIGDQGQPTMVVVYWAILDQFTKRRAAVLLASSEGRVSIGLVLKILAGSLQRLGLQTRPLWDMADFLRGAS